MGGGLIGMARWSGLLEIWMTLACRRWWWLTAGRYLACLRAVTVWLSWPMPPVAVPMRPMTVLLKRWPTWRIRRRPLWSPLIETWLAGFGGMVLWLSGLGLFGIGWTAAWGEPGVNTFASSAAKFAEG